jgi:phage baseplate assembly protein V
MIGWLRWGSVRGVKEGKVQSGRAEVFEHLGRDEAMRPQDYGFAALPVDGQGLVMEVGGHTIILRQDVLASRPALADYEVCIWHKEGHKVTMRAGQIVEVQCEQLVVNAGTSVTFNTPLMTLNTASIQAPLATLVANVVNGLTNVLFAGKSGKDHTHGGVSRGPSQSDGPT